VLEREGVHNLVAIRAGLLCAVIDADGLERTGKGDENGTEGDGDGHDDGGGRDPINLARKLRGELAERFGTVTAAASRAARERTRCG